MSKTLPVQQIVKCSEYEKVLICNLQPALSFDGFRYKHPPCPLKFLKQLLQWQKNEITESCSHT